MVVLGYFAENVVCCQKNIITCHLNLKKKTRKFKNAKNIVTKPRFEPDFYTFYTK